MTDIATKNGEVIFKDGAAAENCNCCGGWYCYGNPCHDVLSVYGPPFMERASSWSCDGDNIPPDSITVRVKYSGQELFVWLWTNFNEGTGNYSNVVQKRLFAPTSENFTETLTRRTDYGRFYDRHCFYRSDSRQIEIHPGAKCGEGWDAGFVPFGIFAREEFVAGSSMPASNFTQTCVNPPTDQTCAAINATQQQKGAFPKYYAPVNNQGSWAIIAWDINAIWSDLPCSTSPNPNLSGFKWSMCFSSLSACRDGQGRQTYRGRFAPLCTVEVIDAVP